MVENSDYFDSNNINNTPILFRTHQKSTIEALLFSSHQGMHLFQIKSAFPTYTEGDILSLIRELMEDYQMFESALEIIEDQANHFIFRVKHAVMVNPELVGFTHGVDYSSSELQLLAFIGYNQPIDKQDIIDILGTKIKKTLKKIEQDNMIEYCENRSVTFRIGEDSAIMEVTGFITTKKFAEYFNIPNDLDTIKALFQEYL